MKSICIFTNTLLSGGAEKQAVLLTKALNKKYNVWLVVYYGDETDQKYLDIINQNNLKTLFLNGSHLKRCLAFYNFLKSESVDIIFSYLLTTNLIGGLIGRIAGVKYTVGGIRNSELPKKKLFIQKTLQNYLNHITIYNNYRGLKALKLKSFRGDKALVISNCIELNSQSIIRKKSDHISIITVGRFQEQKDFYTAIKAVNYLRQYYNKFTYIIIGYGKLEKAIHDWINMFDAAHYIYVAINPVNITEYYDRADIYLMTSILEGLSNSVLEAMNSYLPLVLTDVGDNDRLVIEGENGFLCNSKDSTQIANCLLELCSSYNKRIKFGKRSYEILKENYSYEIYQKSYINFIEALKL